MSGTPNLANYCDACQAIPRHGYCKLAGCPKAPSATPASAAKGEETANHDCLAKRRDGEPMFILLGRDPDAHNIVRIWAERRMEAGGDPEHCQQGLDTAARMKAYAADPANAPMSAPPASAYPTLQPHPSQQAGTEARARLLNDATEIRRWAADCADARTWGGPTMYPAHPIDEARASRMARDIIAALTSEVKG